MKKYILITGASGFIGKKLVCLLLKRKFKIKIIVRKSSKLEKTFNHVNITKVFTKNIFKNNSNWWSKVLKDVSTVIHLAWYVKPPNYLKSKKNIECMNGTLTLAKACARSKINKFLGIGTCLEYDLTTMKKIDIHHSLHPLNLYSSSKVKTFFLLNNLFKKTKINFSWLRLFYVYGKEDYSQKLIPYLHNNLSKNKGVIIKNADFVRDYIHVNKVVKKILKIILKKKNETIYNICSGKPITVKKIAIKIAKKYKKINLLKFKIQKNKSIEHIVGVSNC
jgi:nucleoside-diphosphate-sugar epimerase